MSSPVLLAPSPRPRRLMIREWTLLAATAALASACVSAPRPATPPAVRVPTGQAAAGTGAMIAPQVMAAAGLEGVIGAGAGALTRRFGEPRIDLAEGDTRKLQFAGRNCVLDIYLYPLAAGSEPTATHVAARLRQGGAPADPGACIREVERR